MTINCLSSAPPSTYLPTGWLAGWHTFVVSFLSVRAALSRSPSLPTASHTHNAPNPREIYAPDVTRLPCFMAFQRSPLVDYRPLCFLNFENKTRCGGVGSLAPERGGGWSRKLMGRDFLRVLLQRNENRGRFVFYAFLEKILGICRN